MRPTLRSLRTNGAALPAVWSGPGNGEGRARLRATRSALAPDSQNQMTWRIGDAGFAMFLDSAVSSSLERSTRGVVEDLLRDAGRSPADAELGTFPEVGSFAVHPGGPRVLDAVERCLGMQRGGLASSREVLKNYGNMSSATIFFVLKEELERRTRAEPSRRTSDEKAPIVALGFGPGLTIEAALLEVDG